jgi:hypothetical protein
VNCTRAVHFEILVASTRIGPLAVTTARGPKFLMDNALRRSLSLCGQLAGTRK